MLVEVTTYIRSSSKIVTERLQKVSKSQLKKFRSNKNVSAVEA